MKKRLFRMYEYKYVRVDVEGVWTRRPTVPHHRLIEEYAKEGWRFVQIFALAVSAGPTKVDYFELI
jgi:hypothetical protein